MYKLQNREIKGMLCVTRPAFGIVHGATDCLSYKAKKERKAGTQDRPQSQSGPEIKKKQGETRDKE